jgi:hypothetical protein
MSIENHGHRVPVHLIELNQEKLIKRVLSFSGAWEDGSLEKRADMAEVAEGLGEGVERADMAE